jgi:hypothetical protein
VTKALAAPFWWMTSLIFGYRGRPIWETVVQETERIHREHADQLNNRPGAVIRVRRPSIIIESVSWAPRE